MINWFFFLAEMFVVSAMLLGAYGLRRRAGLTPVITVIASLQMVQSILASSLYWPLGPLEVSPGSAILFASNLAILLVAFSRGGAREARTILYAIVLANISISAINAVLSLHMRFAEPSNRLGIPIELFEVGLLASLVGISLVWIDQIAAILGYAWLAERAPWIPLPVRFAFILAVVLALDSTVYITALFVKSPDFLIILKSSIAAKSAAGVLFGLTWGGYLVARRRGGTKGSAREVLETLLFRADVAELREAAVRDGLTGVYNRRFYDLVVEAMTGDDSVDQFVLLLTDVDRFKAVNDTLGHKVGDEVLQSLARRMMGSCRDGDLVFRLGGDEFAMLLPGAGVSAAGRIAKGLEGFVFENPRLEHPVTLTIGAAVYPDDGRSAQVLYDAADGRLYLGKRQGRHRSILPGS